MTRASKNTKPAAIELEEDLDDVMPELVEEEDVIVLSEDNNTISEDGEEEEEEEDLKLAPDSTVEVPKKKINEKINEEDYRKKEKAELLAVLDRCGKLGGPNFDADQERVLRELTKQKETIKRLLDEMRESKKRQKTYNIQTIFKRKQKSK
ncbi:Protein CBG25674 [Caenorhabditis briggsae]|uniref:Uncharacterized protein n=2 Tax=Caenorhabditis briggsae TaxID=6238 RepID=A0AAE9ADH6_CAEBR|nr:Protein CBG25674 [Caenorhabditis briggsae]ULT92574.1 hypothetical protein L3Y34_009981 [Caenorhabditis briggsae]CAS00799.1 Protein CBG25674 [Caenorhabditis briggsae]